LIALPPILARLLPRLGSPHDGEVVATARAIERVLKSEKRDWHDLAAALTTTLAPPTQCNYEPRRTESDEARQMRRWLEVISGEPWLNFWSAGFVADLLLRPSLDGLSGKQMACVHRIVRQAQDRGVEGRMSERIEKSLGAVLVAVRTHCNALGDEGVIDPDRVRLTVAARVAEAPELVKPIAEGGKGLSGRQAAKVLGVSHTQLQRDLAPKVPKSGTKSAADPPCGAFETIVIDPPWPMTKIERDVAPNQVGFDYPTMDESELREFSATVKAMAAADCHLFMWTTQKFLPLAMDLVDLYGFKYVLTMTWHKAGGFQPYGLPQFNSEFVIYARKGSPKFVSTQNFFCCFNAPRREHSRKPGEFYDIVRLVTKGPRIDVFSREAREGFAQWGNETDKFARTGAALDRLREGAR
jgi:N6-adenosine-specific RNA methylase IME4